MMDTVLHLGFDIGSTTVKFIIIDDADSVIIAKYQRHYAEVFRTVCELAT